MKIKFERNKNNANVNDESYSKQIGYYGALKIFLENTK